MDRNFHPQLIEDAAAWLFWTLANTDGFNITRENVLSTRGKSVLECPEREAIFSRYQLDKMAPDEFLAFMEATANHAYGRTVNEENLIGLIYSEDRVSGRSPSAAGIETAHLKLALSVRGDSLPVCGMLCLRHPLPAVVFCKNRPPRGFIRVADTNALGFSMPLWLCPQTTDEIGDGTWMLTGIFYIPEGPELNARSWKAVIPNSICSRQGITVQGRRGVVDLIFDWGHDDIIKPHVKPTLADKIRTSLQGLFGGRHDLD